MYTLGMPALIENNSVEEDVALCQRLGLRFVELNMNFPRYQLDQMDVAHYRALAKQAQVAYTIHLDDALNVCDFNSYVAGAYRRTVVETVALAKELDIHILNMHLLRGNIVTLPDRKVFLFDACRERYLADILSFRAECEQAIGDYPLCIAIENTAGFSPVQHSALELLLESPHFCLTYDIGHNAEASGVDQDFILCHQDRLKHMHAHDVVGKAPHAQLGTGSLYLPFYFELAAAHQCTVVLEVKTIAALTQSVQWLRRAEQEGILGAK